MKITDLAFFGYSVADLKRARLFYEGVLGLEPSRLVGTEESGTVEYDVGSATLAITNRMGFFKASPNGGMAVLEVADFAEALERLRSRGVRFLTEPFESPACHAVVVSDADGNSLGIHKRKPAGDGPRTP